MSDPYGHGETCACDQCVAWSEGYEAGKREALACLCGHDRNDHEQGRGGCMDDDCGCLLYEFEENPR